MGRHIFKEHSDGTPNSDGDANNEEKFIAPDKYEDGTQRPIM